MKHYNPIFSIVRSDYDVMKPSNKGFTIHIPFDAEPGIMPTISLKYGYVSGFGNLCHECDDSPLKGQTYRIFHQELPKEGDIWRLWMSKREFKVTNIHGFLQYSADLVDLATNKVVAKVTFEDYYKD